VRRITLLAVACCLLAVAVTASPAAAAPADTCAAFTVNVNGQPFTGELKTTIAPPITSITVDGTFTEFTVDPGTFTTRDYTWTGVPSARADKNLPGGRQVLFASKVPNHGATLTSPLTLEIAGEGMVIERNGGGQDMKIQAKDCHQGGLFQMEPEPGTTFTHTLSVPEYTGESPLENDRLCWRTPQGGWTGYDSPELAALDGFTAKTSDWTVQSGGRLGMVIGEDAEEGGCTA
jgi:hypothetical protein